MMSEENDLETPFGPALIISRKVAHISSVLYNLFMLGLICLPALKVPSKTALWRAVVIAILLPS